MTKTQRGGGYQGRSRPALAPEEKRKAITIKLPPDLIAWIATQPEKQTQLIEMGLREIKKQREQD